METPVGRSALEAHLRVLHVDTGREWRGGQTQMLALVRRCEGAVVALPGDAPLVAELRRAGIETVPIGFRGGLVGWAGLRAAIRRIGPDLIAAHTSHAHTAAILAAGRTPVVVHRRVDFVPRADPLNRLKYARPRRYVAVSDAVKRVLGRIGVEPARVDVVYDGVEARVGSPADFGAGPIVAAVGALVPHKGHEWLIRAMAGVPGRLVIAGDGELGPRLRAIAAEVGVADRVVWLGQTDRVADLLASADVFAHPSVEEGMGQAVVEAMLAGCPVVTTTAGGLAEVVDTETGRVCAPRSAAGLSAGILDVLADPQAATARAVRARERARERFSVQAMVEGTLRAYARALEST